MRNYECAGNKNPESLRKETEDMKERKISELKNTITKTKTQWMSLTAE